ncbi:MAG: DUF1156 domain-containing protein [Phormidium sp.]
MTYRKKLIEVALPLEAINMESAREKSIRHGHPSTLHLWWARRPLAACRAVLWASLVDDPSSWPDRFPTEEDQTQERQRLFDILGRIVVETDKKGKPKQKVRGLVSWDDIKEPQIIDEAQREIARCLAWGRGETPPTTPEAVREYIAHHAPPAYDPFAGGGSIPLEAQRLGLEAHASDLNPVAVLINKALIEIPPKFANLAPVNGEDRPRVSLESWRGAQGLAADVRYYGAWMREQALQRIGHLYPPVELENGEKATVIAWLWARTVKCPNPACGCQMPLVSSFVLSSKKGKESYLDPEVIGQHIKFKVSNTAPPRFNNPKNGLKRGTSGVFECIFCGTKTKRDYVAKEAIEKGLGVVQTAVVVEGKKGREYYSPEVSPYPNNIPLVDTTGLDAELSPNPRDVWCRNFGLKTPSDLFTPRQLVALTTFSDLVSEAKDKAIQDAMAAGLSDDNIPLINGGTGARAYGEAIATYLAFVLSKVADRGSTLGRWDPTPTQSGVINTFSRQALPMTWDYAEANPLGKASGSFMGSISWIVKVVENHKNSLSLTNVFQHDATINHKTDSQKKIVSTDPPYFDNMSYSDLSDFFYVWLRRNLHNVYGEIFRTLLVPKDEELIAVSYRFQGSKKKAKHFFEHGLRQAFARMNRIADSDYPLTIYYAFKQAETDSKGKEGESVASTGWETMLEGLMQSDFSIHGTWPMRSEMSNRMVARGTNALASSIVLVCRPRPENAPKTTRRQFLKELKRELPTALKTLQQGNIAPVDLAQASIGPGMAVYSQYSAVLENDGSPLTVRTALQLINQLLDEYLTEQEGEFDSDTRWALTWFEQYQFTSGPYGEAETLSTARNTSVQGLEEAGILTAKAGKVRLVKREELPEHWTPQTDNRIPHWELTQHLIQRLLQNGELGAAELLAALKGEAAEVEIARDLAYRLYNLCDRKGWSSEAIAYNSLVISWPEINRLSSEFEAAPQQGQLF